jgi:hypothetical protein
MVRLLNPVAISSLHHLFCGKRKTFDRKDTVGDSTTVIGAFTKSMDNNTDTITEDNVHSCLVKVS